MAISSNTLISYIFLFDYFNVNISFLYMACKKVQHMMKKNQQKGATYDENSRIMVMQQLKRCKNDNLIILIEGVDFDIFYCFYE